MLVNFGRVGSALLIKNQVDSDERGEMNNKITKSVSATVASLGLIAASLVIGSAAQASGSTFNIDVSVTNVPANVTANKLADRLSIKLCRLNDGVTVAPVTPSGDCRERSLEDVAGTVANGTFTATYALEKPSAATNYAMYLVMEKSSELGFRSDQVSVGVVNTIDSATSALDIPLASLNLGTPAAPSTGRVSGRKVAVNLTVTGLPAGFKADKVKELLTVCANTLASDAVAAPLTPGLCLKSGEIKGGTVNATTGVYSATYQLNAPATDGSQNYALYLQTKSKASYKLAAQTGAGQFVTITNTSGVGSVTAGLDGLTIDLSQNTGVGAIAKVVPIVVPATGSFSVLITKIDGSKEIAVALIPVTVADTQIAIPSSLKNGNYRVQVIATSTGDLFTIDSKGYLDGRVNQVEGRQSR